jgi:hypothetical protein
MSTAAGSARGRVVRDRSGRTIGHIRGAEYHKLITRPDQVLRAPAGYGFDAWAMESQVLPAVDWIVVDNRCDGRLYRCRADDFLRSCLTIDRGAGRQYVLPLSYWHGSEPRTSAPLANADATQAPVQGKLTLF